jgi:N-methylhydantoinase A
VANIIATDVGGTSFDVGLIIDGEPVSAPRPTIRRLPLATRAVDIESIGTGGGSVAWIDEAVGALKMGPKSAGADPGPAAYGRGGTHPTLTDAAVVLGWVRRLGGSLVLDVGAARDAVEREIARPLGIDVVTAAEGMVSVACAQMRDLIRRATLQRGHDPAEFILVAYGGAGPQYAGRFAAELGVDRVLIPMLAGGLSAYGALTGGLRVRGERDLRPQPVSEALELVTAVAADLELEVRGQLAAAGPATSDLVVRRSVALRFYRQIHRIDIDFGSADSAADLLRRLHHRYEQVVGRGTAPEGTPVEVVAVGVEAQLPIAVPPLPLRRRSVADPRGTTGAWFGGNRLPCPVYDWSALGAGQRVAGPAFIEAPTTTAVVGPGQVVTVGAAGDLHLDLGDRDAS